MIDSSCVENISGCEELFQNSSVSVISKDNNVDDDDDDGMQVKREEQGREMKWTRVQSNSK